MINLLEHEPQGEVPRKLAAAINPLICQFTARGTTTQVGDALQAMAFSLGKLDESADLDALFMPMMTMAAALHYETNRELYERKLTATGAEAA